MPERLSLHLHSLGLSLHRVRWLRGDHRFWVVENVDNVALCLGLTRPNQVLAPEGFLTHDCSNWGSWKVKQTKLLRISSWSIFPILRLSFNPCRLEWHYGLFPSVTIRHFQSSHLCPVQSCPWSNRVLQQSWKSSLAEPLAMSSTSHVFCLLVRPGLKLSEKGKDF